MIAGIFILAGLDLIRETVGIEIDDMILTLVQVSGGVLVLVNLIFAYSVCSNKLRIHNVHWAAETCRGYRIKDATNCCVALVRLVCKLYNLIMLAVSWLSTLLALIVCTVLAAVAGGTLFLVGLCEISEAAIQSILDRLVFFDTQLQSTPLSDYISVTNGTSVTDLCDSQDDITRGALYVAVGCPILLLSQVMMLVSYHVVAEVSWRHMKDERRKEELVDGKVGVRGGHEMTESAFNPSGKYGSGTGDPFSGPPTSCGPPGFGGGGPPGFGGSGSARQWSDGTAAGFGGGSQQFTSQNI